MSEEKVTIRDIVKTIQQEVSHSEDLLPERAAELLVKLSALLGNINQFIIDREMTYNEVLRLAYESEEKANRAKIKAESSQAYREKLEARATKEVCLEIIRSLKYYLKAKQEEFLHS